MLCGLTRALPGTARSRRAYGVLMQLPTPISNTFLLLPVAAVAAHLIEEFVWPGGFARWYRRYPPGHTATVTPGFLLIVNAVFVALALLPPLLGASPRGLAVWLIVAMIAGANAIFHIVAVFRTRAYSPGVVTGVCVYLPLAIIGGPYLSRHGLASTGTLLEAIVIAIAYHVWSGWNHRRQEVMASAS